MNPFPKIPTTDLYRFSVISALWLSTLIFTFLVFVFNLAEKTHQEKLEAQTYYSSMSTLYEIQQRLTAIDEDSCSEKNRVSDFSIFTCDKKEKLALISYQSLLKNNIKDIKVTMNSETSHYIRLLNVFHAQWVLLTLVAVAAFLLYFGLCAGVFGHHRRSTCGQC